MRDKSELKQHPFRQMVSYSAGSATSSYGICAAMWYSCQGGYMCSCGSGSPSTFFFSSHREFVLSAKVSKCRVPH